MDTPQVTGCWVGHRMTQGESTSMTALVRDDGSLDILAGISADSGTWQASSTGFTCRLVHRLERGGAVVMRLSAAVSDNTLTGTGTFAVIDGIGAVVRSGEWGIRASRADPMTIAEEPLPQ